MRQTGGEIGSEQACDTSPKRRLLLRIGQVLLILLLCGIACLLVLRWHWRREFRLRIETIRAAGYPATPKEHDAWYAWPQSGANAAHWILGAAAMHQEPPKEDWERLQRLAFSHGPERPHPAEPLAPDLLNPLEQYIRTNDKALESLHEASTIEGCRYPMDLSNGLGTLMNHLPEVRKGMSLACLEAILRSEQGDPDGAVRAVKVAVHAANSLDSEPVPVSRMVRMSGLITAGAALERVLNRVELTAEHVETLYQAFSGLDAGSGLRRALVGERAMWYPLFDKPQTIDHRLFGRMPPTAMLEAYNALGLTAREGSIYLDFAEERIRIAQLPVSQHLAALEAAQARYLRRRPAILVSLAGDGFSIMRSETLYVTRLEMVRVSLAVESYRRAQGGLPETLDQLVPKDLVAVPEDSYDGMPMRYRRLDRGFIVYSVGDDHKDDGGKREPPRDSRASNETWDLVFEVRR